MKYIEKHYDNAVVVAYEEELCHNQLDEKSLQDPNVHAASNGPAIYDMVSSLHEFGNLRKQMFDDQGGICCYCGRRLEYPNHPQYIVEHVHPKEDDRTLAGEYKNLLLSCRPSAEEETARLNARKAERAKFFHCDKSKGSEKIGYTPLQADCHTHFRYDEFGMVTGRDDVARRDLDVLGLTCDWLTKRRAAAIEGEIYDEEGNLLPDDELRTRMSTIMDRDSNNMHSEYCYVIADAIANLLK